MVERIVLNTSVLISGIIGTGSSLEVLKLILQKKVELLISSEIFEEYLIAVNYPEIAKKVDLYYVHPLLDVLYSLSTIIVPQINLNICRDPKDNKFFDVAIEGSAETIITWDTDILSLRDKNNLYFHGKKKVFLVTPTEFLSLR